MIIKCRICGNNFDHPDGKRGKKPDVCQSESCKKAQQKEYNANWKNHKDKTVVPDISKAGWPADTKKCQTCGQLFISDSKSRVCPVCLSAPLPNSIDDSLAEAKAAGYDPEEYGKFKTAKTLAGIEPVDVGLAAKVESTKRAIDKLRPEYVIVDEFYHSDPIGKVLSSETTEQGFSAIVEIEPKYQLPSKCETCEPTSNHDFIYALEDLMDMADKWHMDPDKVYPLAEDILRKGIMGQTTEAGR